jgi:hypothetical protein
MSTLRAQLESDLAIILERPEDWGKPVELIGPDGKEYKTSANSPDPLNPEPLYGQVLKNTVRVSPETGQPLVIGKPAVALRVTSLEKVPEPGEKWIIRFPLEPTLTSAMVDHALTPDRSSEKNSALGYIVLYPYKVEQSS